MVIIIKRLVPVYRQWEKIPKQYHNLRKLSHVTTFKYFYPNIPEILVNSYGLLPNEKIVVFWTKEISLPHFNRYRMKFRKIYSGSLADFGDYLSEWRKKKRRKEKEN